MTVVLTTQTKKTPPLILEKFFKQKQLTRSINTALFCVLTTLPVTATLFSAPLLAEEVKQSAQNQYFQFNINSSSLASALVQFSSQTAINLSYTPHLLKGIKSKGLLGEYSADMALKGLLRDSNLTAIKQTNGSYTISKNTNSNNTITMLAPLIIKGEKFERNLADTLSSVSVHTNTDIKSHHDTDLKDILSRVVGVTTTAESLSIRGVPIEGVGEGSSDAISVYVDGVVQSRRAMTFMRLPTWDVEQVEVYRGSQSSSQGRNAIAGAILVNTIDPSFESDIRTRVNFGQFGELGASLALGGTLVDDFAAFRFTLDYQESDGYLYNEYLKKDANAKNTQTIRGKLLLTPTEELDLLITGFYTSHEQGNQNNDQLAAHPYDDKTFTNTDVSYELAQTGINAELEYRINEQLTLNSITTYSDSPYDSLLDFDQGPSPREDVIYVDQLNKVYTQEFRLAYESEKLQGHVGFYYNDSDETQRKGFKLNAGDFFENPEIFELYHDGYKWQRDIVEDLKIKNVAVFVALDYNITDKLVLSAGARYEDEEQTNINGRNTYGINALNGINPDLDAVLARLTSQTPNRTITADYNALLPNFGLMYQLTDNQNIGLIYKRGYRAGGVSYNISEDSANEFDPEYNDTIEIAYRSHWLDNNLQLNANIYHTNWEDQQVIFYTDPEDDYSSQVGNLGSSTSQGAEFSLVYQVSNNISLYSAVAYNDTSFDNFITDLEDLSGQAFESAPKWKSSLGVQYDISAQLSMALDVVYQSDSTNYYNFDDDGNVNGQVKNESYTIVDLTAQYHISDNIFVSAYAKNLLDKRYLTSAREGRDIDVGEPRQIGTAININF